MEVTSKKSVQFSKNSSMIDISNKSTTSKGTRPSTGSSKGTRPSTATSQSTRSSKGTSRSAKSSTGTSQSIRSSSTISRETAIKSDSFSSRKSSKSEKSLEVPVDIFNDPLYNEDGTRNTKIPFELYIIRKEHEERLKNRKQVKITTITRRDNSVFNEAIRKLKIEKGRENARKIKYIKTLVKSRTADNRSRKAEAKKLFEEKYQCRLQCKVERKRSKSRSRSRSNTRKDNIKGILKYRRPVIKLPPLKMRPKKPEGQVESQKKPRFPIIAIPPIKTRKWVPILHPKPSKPKVVIEYPPLTLRKKPWKPVEKKKPLRKIFRTSKLFYPIPVSTLGKTWHSFKFLSPKQQILSGKLSQYSKKFSFISNGKQSAFIAVVALSTFDLYPMKSWKNFLLDEIITYGDINFRRQLKDLKHKNVIKPSNVYHKIYLRWAKLLIEIGEMTAKGIYDAESAADICSHVKNIFEKFSSLIVLYNGQNYAIWKEENAYYIFNAEDTDENGKVIEKNRGGCCVMRSISLPTIIDYLIDNFRVTKQLYEIFSFRVNQKLMIQDLECPPKEISRACEVTEENNEAINELKVVDQIQQETSTPKTGLAAVLFRHKIEPTFGDSFQYSSLPNHMFITCSSYLNRETKNRASFISSVAVVMLQICKSSLWMSATLERIFQIGNEVYYENVEKVLEEREKDALERLKAREPEEKEPEPIEENPVEEEEEDFDDDDDDEEKPSIPLTKEEIRALRQERLAKPPKVIKVREDIPLTEIKPAVSIGKLKYELSVETLNIGKISSRQRNELNLECGLINLFKHYDYGLIIGSDVVSVWRENGRYFMFDPNQCKAYRRFSHEDIDPYNSCLNCFQNLSDLIQLYIENLDKTQRNSIYKICKIDTKDYTEKSANWQNFKSVGSKKWILSGNISESSIEFVEENRNHQSTCMAVTAISKTRETGISSWALNDIDEIVRIGDEFYSVCVENLKQHGKFKTHDLELNEIGTELKLENIIVDLTYDEGLIVGMTHGKSSLSNGLKKLFKNDDLGIIKFGLEAVAVIKYNDAFFLFDSHGRDEFGRNYKTIDPIDACTVKGSACMLRFTNIEDLSNHLIMNFEDPHFSISKVEVSVRSSQAPCLYNYRTFGDEQYGAILKAFNNYHEDCDEFKCESTLKTECNLLSCLCYANIFNPRFWAPNDLNEILKIGWKFLCKASKGNQLELLKEVEVCSSKLKIEATEDQQGIFMVKERILSDLSKLTEVVVDQTEISVINRSIDGEPDELLNIRKEDSSSMLQNVNLEKRIVLDYVLQAFAQNDKRFAVLSSSLFTIAIFKIENFFYVFDPKASMNGMLTRKRLEDFINSNLKNEHDMLLAKIEESENFKRISMEEKMEELIFGRKVVFGAPTEKPSQIQIVYRTSYGAVNSEDPISISEKGCAYVAWFSTIELLHQHIIKKVPDRFLEEPFNMQFVEISKSDADCTEVTMWNNFEKIHDNHWIIRGTFSQNDSQFLVTHRNNQDVPNCLLALAFKQICKDEEWNTTVLDVVLKFGDRLFKKSLAKKMSINSVHSKDLKLKFHELECPIFIRPFIINCSDKMIHEDLIIKHSDEVPLQNFKNVVNDFLKSNENAGILVSKSYNVGIWKNNDGAFIMFDPHDIGPDGKRKSTGLSSLQRFTNSSDLVEIFWNNIKEIEGFNKFQLYKIKMELNHFKDGEEDVFESMEQDVVMAKFRMINGKSVNPNTTCVEMTICYAIAAHCLCRSLDSEYYTSDIIDRIIMFGNELVCECCTNDEVCFKDFDLVKHTSCPDEINWNFQLNDTFTTIQMDIFRRGIITKEPCPLPNLIFVLEEFFDFHCSGVLVTNEFITSLWKDNNEFYVFYSCRIDKNGKRSDDKGHVGLIIFKTVHELYINILHNIRQQSSSFELRTCCIKMTDNVGVSSKKSCTKKSNKKWMKNVVKEEIIMPAVSFREVEINQDSLDCPEPCNKDLKIMIENLKRSGSNNGFVKFSRGGFICGKLSKNSKSLNEISRKFHSSAICLYSAAMHAVVNMNCWNGDVIDCIILSGNSLYVESSIVCGTSEVDITSIVSPILINNHEVSAKAESCLEFAHEDLKIEHLKPILCELLSCFNACYLSKSQNCWTIVKSDKFYFLFDPLGIEFPGKKISQHRATLYRLDSLDQLLELLLELIECLDEEKMAGNVYTLGGITVTKKLLKKDAKQPSILKKRKSLKCPKFKASKTSHNMQLHDIPEKDQPDCCNNRIKFC